MLILANNSDIEKDQLWEYELSLNPLAIIDKNGHMRTVGDKANLTAYLTQICEPEAIPEDKDNLQFECSVLDMGSILQKLSWKKGDTYGQIIGAYVSKVRYYPVCTAVFDGYKDHSSTKYLTHLKRSMKTITSHTIEIAHHLPFNCESKEAFLANKSKKQAFINMLSDALRNENITVKHARGDADQLIAETAIGLAVDHTTQVVCEDAAIFQLLVNKLRPNSKPLYMVTDKQNAKHPCLHINAIRSKLGDGCARFLPVIHAISGCDTTSRLYGIGKITVLKKKDKIVHEAEPFLSPDATPVEIEEASRRILCLIYDEDDTSFSLNSIRKKKFEKNVIKSWKHIDIKVLPPTNSAAKYHSYKVYHQVQVWLVTDWGWKLVNDHLYPRTMDKAPAPESLMKIIRCGCTLYCDTNQCTCKKNGLFCTELCENCEVDNCTNINISNLLE